MAPRRPLLIFSSLGLLETSLNAGGDIENQGSIQQTPLWPMGAFWVQSWAGQHGLEQSRFPLGAATAGAASPGSVLYGQSAWPFPELAVFSLGTKAAGLRAEACPLRLVTRGSAV